MISMTHHLAVTKALQPAEHEVTTNHSFLFVDDAFLSIETELAMEEGPLRPLAERTLKEAGLGVLHLPVIQEALITHFDAARSSGLDYAEAFESTMRESNRIVAETRAKAA